MTAAEPELEESRWSEWQAGVTDGGVTVTEAKEGGFSNVLLDGRHILFADEPEDIGGADLGPAPYELALMALGACTSITLRMYAARKGWPLETVAVRLRYAEGGAAKPPAERKIERIVELLGPLDAEQRERLLAIANKCPIHELLTKGASVETKLG
jgi:putative redox protein